MKTYEAPAKLNLSLHVMPPSDRGYHPIRSIVQTIEWVDVLDVERSEEGSDSLVVVGSSLDAEDNLVLHALNAAREEFPVPPLGLALHKRLPVAAGLGGGSSDAAAALLAARDASSRPADIEAVASTVGADVPLFLTGGSLLMTGFGETLERRRPLTDFAVAVVVPDFGLSTTDVYAKWDELEGPAGEVIPEDRLPPTLRSDMPMRNDLVPAALSLEPRLGDFMADVRSVWGAPVSLTGSGSACFGYFATLDEASDAATATSHLCSVALGVELRDRGVARTAKGVR